MRLVVKPRRYGAAARQDSYLSRANLIQAIPQQFLDFLPDFLCRSGRSAWLRQSPRLFTNCLEVGGQLVLSGLVRSRKLSETHMDPAHELATLPQLTVAQLRKRYAALFGEPTNARHKVWLCKRIAWRLQASAAGDLSERLASTPPYWPTTPTCGSIRPSPR